MTLHDDLQAFQKMWSWLSAHPAHDENYYMTHVARLDSPWEKSCPLSQASREECESCLLLWNSVHGSMCNDKNSPLNKWRITDIEDPDNRTYYANQVAILAMKAARSL